MRRLLLIEQLRNVRMRHASQNTLGHNCGLRLAGAAVLTNSIAALRLAQLVEQLPCIHRHAAIEQAHRRQQQRRSVLRDIRPLSVSSRQQPCNIAPADHLQRWQRLRRALYEFITAPIKRGWRGSHIAAAGAHLTGAQHRRQQLDAHRRRQLNNPQMVMTASAWRALNRQHIQQAEPGQLPLHIGNRAGLLVLIRIDHHMAAGAERQPNIDGLPCIQRRPLLQRRDMQPAGQRRLAVGLQWNRHRAGRSPAQRPCIRSRSRAHAAGLSAAGLPSAGLLFVPDRSTCHSQSITRCCSP